MDVPNIFYLFVASAAGYLFITTNYKLKYKYSRENGYKLYLACMSYGLGYFLVGTLLVECGFLLAKTLDIGGARIIAGQLKIWVIFVITGFLSYLSSVALNLRPQAKEKALTTVWSNNDFDRICAKALNKDKPIAISLDSRKAYVGYVVDTLTSEPANSHLTILPIYSGHRDEKHLSFKIDVIYHKVIELIESGIKEAEDPKSLKNMMNELEDYFIAYPCSKICSLHIYNDNLSDATASKAQPSPLKYC